MAMIKVVSPSGWNFDRPIAMPLKLSSRGLRGNDRSDFLKQASHTFLAELPQLQEELKKSGSDYVPVHLIALGSTEAWGGNRNGDGFKEAMCRRNHESFVKHSRWYRNHKNKPPGNTAYGQVKASAYNDTMRRVELLSFLNATKEAAERHQGAIADLELEKLAKGEDIPVSMSCRVPYDECSACGNKAKTREDYCTAKTCKAGGCQDNLSKVVKVGSDLHHLIVDNPDAFWFDISKVHRQACRTAMGAGADYFQKAASDGGVFDKSGAEIASELNIAAPYAAIEAQAANDTATMRVKLAYGLAALDMSSQSRLNTSALAFVSRGNVGDTGFDEKQARDALVALADVGAVLPLSQFARLEKRAGIETAVQLLPGVYARMIEDGTIESYASRAKYAFDEVVPSHKSQVWAQRYKRAYSLDQQDVVSRATAAALRGEYAVYPKANNTFSQDGEKLARDYAAYTLGALQRVAASPVHDFTLTALFALQQNRLL